MESVRARETSPEENPRNQDRHEPWWSLVGWQSPGSGFGGAQAMENPSEWTELPARGHNQRIGWRLSPPTPTKVCLTAAGPLRPWSLNQYPLSCQLHRPRVRVLPGDFAGDLRACHWTARGNAWLSWCARRCPSSPEQRRLVGFAPPTGQLRPKALWSRPDVFSRDSSFRGGDRNALIA